MQIDVTDAVYTFLSILEFSWDNICKLPDESGSLVDDWLQGNWERVVEASIPAERRIYLEVYGDGADCNTYGSRAWKPEAIANAAVYVLGNEDISIDRFCTMESGWPAIRKTLNFICFDLDSALVMPLNGARFICKMI